MHHPTLSSSILVFLSLYLLLSPASSFTPILPRINTHSPLTQLQLIPLSEYPDDIPFLTKPESYRLCIGSQGQLRPYHPSSSSSDPYILGIAEEDDLPSISRLTVEAFGAGTVTLSHDLNDLERALLGPTVGLWNEYTETLAFTEVLSGLRSRMMIRLPNRDNDETTTNNDQDHRSQKERYIKAPEIAGISLRDAIRMAEKSSVVLVLAREDSSKQMSMMESIATVELRLQPTDGKIPFSQPWLDRYERKIAKFFQMGTSSIVSSSSSSKKSFPPPKQLQPYLSNLCVSESVRGRQIGTALVRCVETMATEGWGYEKLYLHVDLENTPALKLYEKEGFQDVGIRWNPFWSGKAAEIGYFVKNYKS